ncbi:glycosyltransferase family 1 protein [Bacteroides ovatus]|uniref:Glycosyltransferase family 1 protein n=1 Tax=Bacteroides ovatus TaxID=28116 RepID=A0A414WTQ7_BACOV|nr:glycosyltransferase family 1 protein [Bacteroides ovatus]RHH41323.1 glycosyltransferase family 1 protein [Bacteroides ovatus]RHH41336.1 glycosyltransferase family 1 protein [Bacteroides ovatus]
MSSNPIRVLYVNGGLMNRGGIESYMMNYYRHFDRDKVQIDFVVHNAGGFGYYDEEIKSLGGKIFILPQKSKHPLSYISKLKKVLKQGEYKIIHTHMDAMGAWVLKTAKTCGIPVRIAHSHNTQHLTTSLLKLFFLERARKMVNLYATHRMACSEVAGRWLFANESFQVIRNAVDIDKFKFNKEIRKVIRDNYHISDDEFVIGHVGRFDIQKNHSFLIDVFAKLCQSSKSKIRLMLIGEGYLLEEITKKVQDCHLEDKVIFTGVRDDANLFYNAFDLFVLPSLFEGLPVVSIETQMNGCTTFFSSVITTECRIAPNIGYLPLDINVWVREIIAQIRKKEIRQAASFDLHSSGYDINEEAKRLQQIYMYLWKNN